MANGRPQITIMVGGLEKVIYLPAMLTQQLGNFERNDIDVTLLGEQSGASAETALLTGDVQAVVGFYDHTIDLQAKDQCIKSVVQMADVPGEVELVSTKNAGLDHLPCRLPGQKPRHHVAGVVDGLPDASVGRPGRDDHRGLHTGESGCRTDLHRRA